MRRSSNRKLGLKIRGIFRRQLVRPLDPPAARHRLLARVQQRGPGVGRRFRLARGARPDACFLARQQRHPAVCQRWSEQNQHQVYGHGQGSRQRLLVQQACRLHHLNAAKEEQGGGPHFLGQQPARWEHRAQQRSPRSVLRRHRQNVAGRQLAHWAKVRVRVRLVEREMFRHRVGVGVLHLSDSVRRHQQRVRVRVQMSVAGLSVGHRRKSVSLVVRRPQVVLLAKRVARDKEGRVLMVNLAGNQEVERRERPSAVQDSQRAEGKSLKGERRRQGHNNCGSICHSGSGKKSPEPLLSRPTPFMM
jgi:hypothetical protein